jgi:transposase
MIAIVSDLCFQIKGDVMAKKYVINLSAEEREQLERIAMGVKGKLKIARWKVQRALVMLKCDQGEDGAAWTDEKIAEAFGVTVRSIENWRKQAVLEGPLAVLERKKRIVPPTPAKLDGEGEVKLTMIACSTPPTGFARWSLRLLAERLVELQVIPEISYEAVRRALKKTH